MVYFPAVSVLSSGLPKWPHKNACGQHKGEQPEEEIPVTTTAQRAQPQRMVIRLGVQLKPRCGCP